MPASPKWTMLAEAIYKQIVDGTLAPGDKLPSTRQLCAQHDVSEIVVRNAMIHLKSRKLLVGVPGVGVYVADDALEHLD